MRFARKIGGMAGRHGRHGMAVEVDAVAVPCMRRGDRLRHRVMVGSPAIGNARLHFGNGQFALVDRQTVVGRAPDQALAQSHFAQGAGVGLDRLRPGFIEKRNVDFGQVAVRIEIAARKVGFDPAHAQGRRKGIQLFHMRVFGRAQRQKIAGKGKVFRVVRAAVR